MDHQGALYGEYGVMGGEDRGRAIHLQLARLGFAPFWF